MNKQNPSADIRFEEVSASAGDFLHELRDPSLIKSGELPPEAKADLQRHQLTRLQATVDVLVEKREELNQRMDAYLGNLRSLIACLQQSLSEAEVVADRAAEETDVTLTLVRCLHCESERRFPALRVIYARESEECINEPTDVYVLEAGVVKKGRFNCAECGTDHLVIQAYRGD